ncbi:MAG: hypothetical protein AUG92_02400 [Alphaproteobacteria bacterium 13_1_20CM_4_65_11]|nr:MAG: hypothetical protein AUG92_02400 [Alphaproteobacteria bacterium 13_1_20CM_4_65_11]
MSEAADRLLAPDDPLPVRVLRPEGRSDFVLTADHAGRAIPKRLGMLGLPEDELARHIAWDIGIAGVTERLSEALGAAAVREIFQPYHARIEQLLESRSASGRRTLLIAMHSFTPVFKSVARKVDIGVLYNRDARLPYIMLDLLRHEGDLNVGDNQPYAVGDLSDYTVPVHGEQRGLPHVEIEIRQDLIADAAGQAAWAARLARLLSEADARLRESGI